VTFPTDPAANQFGGTPVVVHTAQQISPQAIEGIAQLLEIRGIRTPISQIVGYTQQTARSDSVVAEAHTTSSTYADPNVSGGAGPTLTGLMQGSYTVWFGGAGGGLLASNVVAFMAVSVNGSVPSNDDLSCEYQATGHVSGARVILAQLSSPGNTNTLKLLYRSSDGTDRCDVRRRWIVAIPYGGK
jgi:hypothetical protein